MEAARVNRIPFVGCAYGYAPEEITGADVRVKSAPVMILAVLKLLSA
jgi:phosphoglycolate phosphatase